jgi:hypothetical protein
MGMFVPCFFLMVLGDPSFFPPLHNWVMTQWTATGMWLGPVILLVLLAVLVIHESGHLVAGLCAGFEFNSMRIGPLEIHRPFRISLSREMKGQPRGWSSGWVQFVPASAENLRWRALAMILAGPAANLLSAAIVLLLPYSKGFASVFFIFFSALTGLLNLVPMQGRIALSDGSRIWMLLRSREKGERWLAILKLGGELANGVPPESLSADFLAKAVAIRDQSPDTATAHNIAYAAAWRQHKDVEAAQYLELCLEYSGYAREFVREAFICDASVFQSRRRKRVDLAEQWLALLPKTTVVPGLRARAEAGIFEAQGDIAGALKKLDEVEALTNVLPNELQRKLSLEFLKRWKSELVAETGAS